jgi:putative spermidine/putrescine transport system permease protein
MMFPPEGLSLKWYGELAKNSDFIKAAGVSFCVGMIASITSTLLGLTAAVGLRYSSRKVKSIVMGLMLSPLFIPSIVMGLALCQLSYTVLGTTTIWMLVFGHIILTIPYSMRTIATNLEVLPVTLDEAAMSAGAKPFRVMWSILLPLAKPGVFSGWLLSFLMSWNDFNISIFLARPKFYPLSIEIYEYMIFKYTPLLAAMSVVVVLFTVVIVLVIQKFFGLSGVTNTR